MMKKILLLFIAAIISFYIFSNVYNYNSTKDKKQIVSFSTWGSQSEISVLKNIIKDFEKEYPEIKIELLHVPQNYFQKLHLLFASNQAPDVIFINNQNIQLYIDAGLLEDLSGIFSESEDIFYNETLDCFRKNGGLYAIPRDFSNLVIYYNKDILKKENISFPVKITNLEELKELCIKLASEKYFAVNIEEDSLYLLAFLSSNGGGIISDDKKSVIINSPESIEALNLYCNLIHKYHAAPSKSQIGSMTTAQMFINGKLALYIGGRWMVPKFRETVNFEWDVAEFPSSANNKIYIDASGWAVSEKSKNKENACKLIKYLSSKYSSGKFTEIGLIVPARKDTAQSSIFLDKSKKPQNCEVFLKSLKNSKPTPVNKNYSIINDIIKEKIKSMISGKLLPEEAFDDKTVNRIESLL